MCDMMELEYELIHGSAEKMSVDASTWSQSLPKGWTHHLGGRWGQSEGWSKHLSLHMRSKAKVDGNPCSCIARILPCLASYSSTTRRYTLTSIVVSTLFTLECMENRKPDTTGQSAFMFSQKRLRNTSMPWGSSPR
jgi:hypothetical protein